MVGTISSLLLVWFIIRLYGVALQGEFVLIKSWIDLSVVIASFGMPQSFIYAINKLGVSWVELKKVTLKYIPFTIVVNVVSTYIWFEYVQQQSFLTILHYTFIAIGIASLTGFALLRGLYLTKNDSGKFAVITIAPNVLLLLSFLLLFICVDRIDISLMYLLSGALAFILVLIMLQSFDSTSYTSNMAIPWGSLFSNGFNVFAQSIFISLLPLGTYFLMTKLGFSSEEIGIFSVALYTYTLFTLPLNMVSPIFYNRWSVNYIRDVLEELLKVAKFGLVLIPILVIIYYLLPILLPFFLGEQVSAAVSPARLLLLSTLSLYFNNLLCCFFSSQGKFKLISYIFFIKIVFCFVFLILFSLYLVKSLDSIALAWLFTEVIVLCILLIFWGRCYATN